MRIQRIENERPTIVYNLADEVTIRGTMDSKTAWPRETMPFH